jgi:phosphate transport system substrate-binding protein
MGRLLGWDRGGDGMAVVEWFGQLVNFLGGAGPVLLGIGLLIATPYIDRLLLRRKRLSFRVLYNSKIGLGPEPLRDGTDLAVSGTPQLRQAMRLLNRMSIVVIRIRNKGSYDIAPHDFDEPLSFTFGRRVVWNARVSEASTDKVRQQLRESLCFFSTEASVVESPPARDNLLAVRRRLAERMSRWLRTSAGQPAGPDNLEPRWHGVRLEGLSLGRRQRAKLVIVLQEPDSSDGAITKDVIPAGRLKEAGLIRDEGKARRVTLPRVTGAVAAVLSLLQARFGADRSYYRMRAGGAADRRVNRIHAGDE